MNLEKLEKKLEQAEYNRIEFASHFYQRAKRRNIDAQTVKEELENHKFTEVRENNQSDPNFQHSYKVTVETENGRYEIPIYFNVPGPKILVKSVWPR